METHLLRIRLLGELEVRADSDVLPPFESARTESLLAYLLLHRGAPQPRERIAFLFWPDSSEAQARTNLRHVLHKLRQALPRPDRFLDVSYRTIRWTVDAPYQLDLAEFEDALTRAGTVEGTARLDALRHAVDLYGGDLLEGRYDEWLSEPRERLRQQYADALGALVEMLEARGEHARAVPYAERMLRLDPLREESYRLLIRLHAACGDRARALRAYHACTACLERELGVLPDRRTRGLYEALLPAEDELPADDPGDRAVGPVLVGRTAEWTRLLALWRACKVGRSRLVLVSGEPGAGKSRLVEELRCWCAREGAVTAEARGYPTEGSLAYAPVVSWLRSEGLEVHWRRLGPTRRSELARLLPELTEPGETRIAERSADAGGRLRLFETLARSLVPTPAPLLLVADDLQWWDGESLQFVHYLLRSRRDAPLLVAATARAEEIDGARAPAGQLLSALRATDLVAEIELGRLSRRETGLLLERCCGRSPVDAELDRVFAETEGNPLFVTEAASAGWNGTEDFLAAVGPRVKGILEWRLDQLSDRAREVVGLASAIGREFTSELLAEAGSLGASDLVPALDELWRRRILRERDAESYDFSHDKLREVCYRGLSLTVRRQHHVRVARALERIHVGEPAPWSGQLASHYDRAGMAWEAMSWYSRAAGEAMRVHAQGDAVRLLDRALVLLRSTPRSRERDERELALTLALLAPLAVVEGAASTRLAQVQRRAGELADTLGGDAAPELLRSIALTQLSAARFHEAQGVAEQLRERGEREGDEGVLAEAHYLLGISAFWQGQLAGAKRHFEAAVDDYRAEHRDVHVTRYGLDPQVICLSRLSNTLWFLGRPGAALRARDEAYGLAERVGHPQTSATVLAFAALLALELRDEVGLREYTRALGELCGEHESPVLRVTEAGLRGYADVLDGRHEDGLARIRGAVTDAERAQHAPGLVASLRRLLLAACEAGSEPEIGFEVAELLRENGAGARLWAAESLRHRAVFRSALGAPSADVEVDLRGALDVARRQGARSLEVRAAASLLRHRLKESGRRGVQEARGLLSACLDRLPERADVPELREIGALLER